MRNFGIPFGSKIRPDAQELHALAVARDLRTRGKKLREIQATLAEAGLVNRRGKPYQLSVIHGLVKQNRPALHPTATPGESSSMTFSE